MLNLIMGLAGQRLLGIRACVSVGNAEVLGLPELVNHFVADPECSVLGLVVESIDRPRALMQALSAARAVGKPVVVLKIGVSELGRANSLAHTGRMAGPEQGWSALFDRLDVCAVRDLDDFIETLTLFGDVVPRLTQGAGSDTHSASPSRRSRAARRASSATSPHRRTSRLQPCSRTRSHRCAPGSARSR